MLNKKISAALLMILLLTGAANAQIVYEQPFSSGLRFNYCNWSLDGPEGEETISQKTFILSGFAPIRDNLEARYHIATGFNTLDYSPGETDMSGLGDLRIQLSQSLMKDQLLLSAGMNLPTGKKELDPDGERAIIEFLSRDYLSLPMRRYGEGFGFNLQAGYAAELGSFKCGVTAVYDICGEYTPYEGGGDYDPGNAISLSGTAGTELGSWLCTGDLGFSLFSADKFGGEEIYKQAPQLSTRLTATRPGEVYTMTIGARFILRGRNKRYSLNAGTVESQLKKYGDEFDLFLRATRPLGTGWNLGGMVGTRQILESEELLGRSSLINFGIDLGRELSGSTGLDAGLLYHIGSAEGGDVDISGLQLSCSFRVTY